MPDAMITIYDDGQMSAADSAPEFLRDMCFIHNALLISGKDKAAVSLRDTIFTVSASVVDTADALYGFYQDNKITLSGSYTLDLRKPVTIHGQVIEASWSTRKKSGRSL